MQEVGERQTPEAMATSVNLTRADKIWLGIEKAGGNGGGPSPTTGTV